MAVLTVLLGKALQKEIGFSGDDFPARVTMGLDDVGEKKSDDKPLLIQGNIDVVTAIASRRSIRKFSSEPALEARTRRRHSARSSRI